MSHTVSARRAKRETSCVNMCQCDSTSTYHSMTLLQKSSTCTGPFSLSKLHTMSVTSNRKPVRQQITGQLPRVISCSQTETLCAETAWWKFRDLRGLKIDILLEFLYFGRVPTSTVVCHSLDCLKWPVVQFCLSLGAALPLKYGGEECCDDGDVDGVSDDAGNVDDERRANTNDC